MAASKKLLDSIHLAQSTERKGIRFYLQALDKVVDANSKQILKFLISEEQRHLKMFMDLEKDLKHGDNKDKKASVAEFVKHKQKSPMFSRSAYKKVEGKEINVITLFTIALKMEQEGIKLYERMAKETKEPDIKRFLKKLADDEREHFEVIKHHEDPIYNYWYWDAMEQPPLEGV